MKRYKKNSIAAVSKITAAESTTPEDKLDDALNMLKEDFDYVLSGLEKLGRSGAENLSDAQIIAEKFSASIQETLKAIADKVSE